MPMLPPSPPRPKELFDCVVCETDHSVHCVCVFALCWPTGSGFQAGATAGVAEEPGDGVAAGLLERLRTAAEALPPYVFDGQIGNKLPDFDKLFDPPVRAKHAPPHSLSLAAPPRLCSSLTTPPPHHQPAFFGDYARVLTQLALGPALSGAPPHFHGDAWNALLYGSKRWFLFEPAEAYFARPRQRAIDWVLEAGQAAAAGGAERSMGRQCMQEAGDILCVSAIMLGASFVHHMGEPQQSMTPTARRRPGTCRGSGAMQC